MKAKGNLKKNVFSIQISKEQYSKYITYIVFFASANIDFTGSEYLHLSFEKYFEKIVDNKIKSEVRFRDRMEKQSFQASVDYNKGRISVLGNLENTKYNTFCTVKVKTEQLSKSYSLYDRQLKFRYERTEEIFKEELIRCFNELLDKMNKEIHGMCFDDLREYFSFYSSVSKKVELLNRKLTIDEIGELYWIGK